MVVIQIMSSGCFLKTLQMIDAILFYTYLLDSLCLLGGGGIMLFSFSFSFPHPVRLQKKNIKVTRE